MADALDHILNSLSDQVRQHRYAFVNADCANQYYRDADYKGLLATCDHVFADGVGVKIAARWQGIGLIENVNGTDMFPLLCERLQNTRHSVYLLGAKQAVLDKLLLNIKASYPKLNIAGSSDGYTYKEKPKELASRINDAKPDLILVAMGAPRQDRWIAENLPTLNARSAIGVGGLFDFYSGEVSRAPEWLREMSLEWVWRLAMQPLDKGKRYLIGNPLFLMRAFVASYQTNKLVETNKKVTHEFI